MVTKYPKPTICISQIAAVPSPPLFCSKKTANDFYSKKSNKDYSTRHWNGSLVLCSSRLLSTDSLPVSPGKAL